MGFWVVLDMIHTHVESKLPFRMIKIRKKDWLPSDVSAKEIIFICVIILRTRSIDEIEARNMLAINQSQSKTQSFQVPNSLVSSFKSSRGHLSQLIWPSWWLVKTLRESKRGQTNGRKNDFQFCITNLNYIKPINNRLWEIDWWRRERI